MTMSIPGMSGASTVGAQQPGLSPSTTNAAHVDLLPSAKSVPLDAMSALYKLMADSNQDQSKQAKETIVQRTNERKRKMEEYEAALEAARKASEKHGFLDSIGLGGLAGMAVGSPVLVLADISMHMARMTPEALANFEKDHAGEIETAAKLYAAMVNAAALKQGFFANPEALRAAAALGGLLVKETGVAGKESDWAGTGMLLYGSAGTGATQAAATSIAATKHGAVADDIRTAEKETEPYTKWAALAGMAVAAAGACVASFGTATMVVVAIGVALSASGFTVSETGCLDDALGKDAARWVSLGMMVAGAVTTGAGAAAAAGNAVEAAKAMELGGHAVDAASKMRQGTEQIRDAAAEKDVWNAQANAKTSMNQARRLQRLIEDVIDTVRDLKDNSRKVSATINQIQDTQAQTQLISATGVRA